MKLTAEEVAEFEDEGYLFFPNTFSSAEAKVLKNAAGDVYAMDREEVWRESSGVARTAFAAHTYNEAFMRLGCHPRLIGPVCQLLDGQVYIHQYKVNAKAAFDGDVWQWHQDYGTWKRDDDMPEPRAMNIRIQGPNFWVLEIRPTDEPPWVFAQLSLSATEAMSLREVLENATHRALELYGSGESEVPEEIRQLQQQEPTDPRT